VGLVVNTFWGVYNIIALLVIVRAAVYRLPAGWNPQPPVAGAPGGAPRPGR
jgi:hypothetical protein